MGTLSQGVVTGIEMIVQLAVVFACASVATARLPNIVNGDDVDTPGKYPWQGSMQSGTWHFCGCSLIAKKWALTASHCVEGNSAGRINVVFGAHDVKTQKYGNPKTYKVAQIIMHENYKQGGGFTPNDIALLKLTEEVQYNDYVQPIQLATSESDSSFDECVVSGWGRMKVGGSFKNPNVLQEAATSIISIKKCKQYWGSYVHESVVCIWNGRATSCQGDSGGPLACRNYGGDWSLVGATSWGPADCNTNYPAAYASVPYFLDWIKTNSGV